MRRSEPRGRSREGWGRLGRLRPVKVLVEEERFQLLQAGPGTH